MNCNNYNTIRVTAGNAFSLLLPLKEKQYISEQPIEEVINAALLTDVQVLLNNEEWNEYELGEDGVLVHFPSTLSKGVYNIELTAKYNGVAIRAAYFQCLSIVAWSYQSDAENYIPTSPLVADAAFIISVNGDEELTALKEQYRNAIAATEAEKAEYERKVAELNGVAQEESVKEVLEEVQNININLTPITGSIGTPAQGQSPTLFGAIGDVALSAQTLQSLADSWAAMVTNKTSLAGWVLVNGQVANGVGDLMTKYLTSLLSVYDESVVKFNRDRFFENCTTVERIELPNLDYVDAYSFSGCKNLKEIVIPNVNQIGIYTSNYDSQFANCTRLEKIELPLCVYISSYRLFFGCTSLKRVSFPHNMHSIMTPSGGEWFKDCVNLIDLEFGYASNINNTNSWSPTNALNANSQTLLTQDDLDAGFTNNLEKLLYNIREHIAANLPVAQKTITFSAAVKAAILADQPTADAFTNKGWTIA